MLVYIIIAVICFGGGFLFGSNNPLPGIRAKIVAKAQADVNAIKK